MKKLFQFILAVKLLNVLSSRSNDEQTEEKERKNRIHSTQLNKQAIEIKYNKLVYLVAC